MSEHFGPHVLGQAIELRFKFVADFDDPSHHLTMAHDTYGLQDIFDRRVRTSTPAQAVRRLARPCQPIIFLDTNILLVE